MKHRHIIATTSAVAVAIVLALVLVPKRSIRPEPRLATPQSIPESARAVIRSKMHRHAAQMTALVSSVAVLDYDGAARTAGEIFDEPTLARPVTGDELNGLLPEPFFALQDALRSQARDIVRAAARRNNPQLGETFAALTRGCISCHEVYLAGGR